MRICIFGAGAVGSHFAVRLALAGHDVSCVMRGPHLAAVQSQRPDAARRERRVQRQGERLRRSGDARTAGPRHLDAEGDRRREPRDRAASRCWADDTPSSSRRTAFPGGTISACPPITLPRPISPSSIPAARCAPRSRKQRIIGGVIFSSNEVIEPGVVANLSPERNMLLIGECDDRASERIAQAARAAGSAKIASAPDARRSARRSGRNCSPTCRCRCCAC